MRKFNKYFTVLVLIFLYVPMIVLGIASFNDGQYISNWQGFTLTNYAELFKDGNLSALLLNSLIVALISSALATILGTMAAMGIHSMGRKMRAFTMNVTSIPMTNPDIVTGVSLALLFVFIGTLMKTSNVLGFTTLLIAHITFNLPYVILAVLPKLSQMDPDLRNAALDLGCTPFQAFTKVTLHEIMPGVISGALMAFTMSLDDFVISYFVYGPRFITLPIEIYSYVKKPLHPKVYALFTLLFIAILLVMVLMNVLQAKEEKKTHAMRRSRLGGRKVKI